jgi:hypothetical protein
LKVTTLVPMREPGRPGAKTAWALIILGLVTLLTLVIAGSLTDLF